MKNIKAGMLLIIVLLLLCECFGGFPPARYNFGRLSRTDVDPEYLPTIAGATYPKKFFAPTPLSILAYDDKDAAELSDGNGTRANDSVNYQLSDSANRSVKLTSDGISTGTSITYTYGATQDLTDASGNPPFIKVRLFIHEGTSGGVDDFATIDTITLQVSNTAFANWGQAELLDKDVGNGISPGWWTFIVTPEQFTDGGGGGEDFTDVDIISIKMITTVSTSTVAITIDSVEFLPSLRKPLYMFTMDDGQDGCYEMASYLASKGIRGTFYIVPSLIGTSGYLTLAQLKEMHASGHLIANHGWNHINFKTSTDTQKVESVTVATEWLCNNGFADGSRIFAAPFGGWDYTNTELLLGRYIDSLRLASMNFDTGQAGKGGVGWYRPDFIFTSAFDTGTVADQALTAAIADNSMAVVLFHAETAADLDAHIDAVAAQIEAGNIESITPLDLLNREAELWGNAIETGVLKLLSTTTVALDANADTDLYTVPTGKTLILSHAMLKVGADPDATDISIGQGGAETDFVGATDLNLLTAANDVCRIAPIPSLTAAKEKAYAAGTIIQAQVTNQAGGATNTLYLYGTLH